MSTVAVALSGGADSAVVALFLRAAGYDIFGIHLVLNQDAHAKVQREKAEGVARHLGIDLHVHDAIRLFTSLVVTPSRTEYQAGTTPNPCVTCNRVIKFSALLDHARALGANTLATGHYARVEEIAGRHVLMRALDRQADQSYFLYSIDAAVLPRILFPLGGMRRSEVRAIAAQEGFSSGKPSQDICFDVRPESEGTPGDVVDIDGNVVGRHRGLGSFTIGQRRGLGVDTGSPLYVVRIDAHRNEVVVGSDADLFCTTASLGQVRWLSSEPPSSHQEVQAKVRYRSRSTPAHVVTSGDGSTVVLFAEPQRAVAPGQSAVLYDDDIVLGGGIVEGNCSGSLVEEE